MRSILVPIVAVEKQYYLFRVYVCKLSYLTCKAHASCYIVICGLSGCTTFSHIISQTIRISGNKAN